MPVDFADLAKVQFTRVDLGIRIKLQRIELAGFPIEIVSRLERIVGTYQDVTLFWVGRVGDV